MWEPNYKAKPEYATADIRVWWDMRDCPIPEGYDARRVRPSLEVAFKKLGYSGRVSITAYGDQTQTPAHIQRGLSSTGVCVAHAMSESICAVIFDDMVIWRGHHPPPATMMLISNHVEDVFSWDLCRLQQDTKYNLFLAYSVSFRAMSILDTSAEWRWKKLLRYSSADEQIISTELPLAICKSCDYEDSNVEGLREHLSSRDHALREMTDPCGKELSPVTKRWARNYVANPIYATAKIAVWWDMSNCPVPEGYDARRVRPSIEAAFKDLGYSGPVSITAYGDQTKTPDHLLRGLSSTGVAVAHTIPEVIYSRMFTDLLKWRDRNPPPATVMIISDTTEPVFSRPLAREQQRHKYNLFLAYSFRPYKMSVLLTSAEWLWHSLLAVSVTRKHFLQRCSEKDESTGVFYCRMCHDYHCNSLDGFRKHLSTKEHAHEVGCILKSRQLAEYEEQLLLEAVLDNFPKYNYKRLRKTYQTTGFRFHNHLLLANHLSRRRRARKSQTCNNE